MRLPDWDEKFNVKATTIALSWKIRIVTIACSIRHMRSEQPVGKQGAAFLVVKGSASGQQKRSKKDAELKVGMHLFLGAPYLMPGMRLISSYRSKQVGSERRPASQCLPSSSSISWCFRASRASHMRLCFPCFSYFSDVTSEPPVPQIHLTFF